MERNEKILRYENGESISSIANDARVSRQAIIRCLQRAGVHIAHKGGRPVAVIKSTNKPVVKVNDSIGLIINQDCPIDSVPQVDQTKLGSIPKRIGRNLYVTNTHYIVKFFKEGKLNESKYSTREEIIKAYNL